MLFHAWLILLQIISDEQILNFRSKSKSHDRNIRNWHWSNKGLSDQRWQGVRDLDWSWTYEHCSERRLDFFIFIFRHFQTSSHSGSVSCIVNTFLVVMSSVSPTFAKSSFHLFKSALYDVDFGPLADSVILYICHLLQYLGLIFLNSQISSKILY